jgi:hypothetical protein
LLPGNEITFLFSKRNPSVTIATDPLSRARGLFGPPPTAAWALVPAAHAQYLKPMQHVVRIPNTLEIVRFHSFTHRYSRMIPEEAPQ